MNRNILNFVNVNMILYVEVSAWKFVMFPSITPCNDLSV